MKNLLNDNSKFNVMKVERTLKTIQEKVHNVFGPLSKLWCLMDEERDRYPENKDLQSISSLFDQVVLLLGQTENAIAYQRRENILVTLLDSGSKVKDMLKSQSKELNDSSNEYLFGEGFEEKLLKDSKAIKKSQAVFTGLKPASKPSTSGSGAGSKRLFPSGPLFQARGREQWRNQFGQTRGKKLFSFITSNRVFRKPGIASSPKCAPSSKEFVSSGTNSRPPVIRKNKILSGKLESVIPRTPSIRMGSGIPDTISFKPPSKEASSVTNLLQGGASSSGQRSLLAKQAVEVVNFPSENQFLSSIFLVPKKGGGNRPVINLKELNHHIPYTHFKIESLSLLKELLKKEDFMCKVDLKDAYFAVPLHQNSRKFVIFQWREKMYQFLVLCFGLSPAPRIFSKLKIPVALLRRLNVRLIIYLDDCLLLGATVQETLMARDNLIYVLQHLGFTVNFQISVLDPS